MTVTVGVNLLWLVPGVVGGSEEYTTRLLEGLADRVPPGLEIVLYALPALAISHPDVTAAFETVFAPVHGRHKAVRVVAESTWLARRVASRGVTFVHHAGGTMPLVRTRPGMLTIHDLQPLLMPDSFSIVKRTYLKLRVPPSARKARLVVAPSAAAVASIVESLGVDARRTMIVGPGVTFDPLGSHGEAGDVAARYRIDGRFVLYPAITYPHKNHSVLVRAFARIATERPDVLLVLPSGAAGAETALREEIDRLGIRARVRRIGRVPVSDLDWLLRHAELLAFPSRFEGFGLPVLEAMAVGCPVVAAAATAIPDVVGDAGLLVPPDDVDAWAGALGRLLDDPAERERLSAAGRVRATIFSWRTSVERLVDAYEWMVDDLGRPRLGRTAPADEDG